MSHYLCWSEESFIPLSLLINPFATWEYYQNHMYMNDHHSIMTHSILQQIIALQYIFNKSRCKNNISIASLLRYLLQPKYSKFAGFASSTKLRSCPFFIHMGWYSSRSYLRYPSPSKKYLHFMNQPASISKLHRVEPLSIDWQLAFRFSSSLECKWNWPRRSKLLLLKLRYWWLQNFLEPQNTMIYHLILKVSNEAMLDCASTSCETTMFNALGITTRLPWS